MRKEWAEEFRTLSPHKVAFPGLSPRLDLLWFPLLDLRSFYCKVFGV